MNKIRILSLALAVCLLAGCRSNSSEPEVSTSQKPIANAPTTSQTQATTPSQTEGEVVPAPETTAPSVDEPIETPPTINWSDWIDVVPAIPDDEPVDTPPIEEPSVTPPPETDAPAVSVIPLLYWNYGKPRLSVTWINNADYSIEYGHSFGIQQLDGEQWVRAEYGTYPSTAIAYGLWPGQCAHEDYALTYFYGTPGQYRFISDYYVDDGTGRYVSHEVTAEFTLSDTIGQPTEFDPGDVTVEPQLYWEDGLPKLAVKWTNNSSHTITTCDCCCVLQRLVDGQWVFSEYEDEDRVCWLVGCDFDPGESYVIKYRPDSYLGISGQYRFVGYYDVEGISGDYVSYGEFTLDWSEEELRDVPTFEPAFTARYLSTPALIDEVQYPEPIALYTTDQFWEYSLANESAFDLREYHTLWSEYSDNFFDDHYLIVIPLEGGVDSVDHEVQLLQGNYLGNHHVFIGRQRQDEGSGSWHIILEVEKPKSSSFPRGPYVQTTLYEIGE
ncbi:MAG: hypothetical protein IJB11_04890 [Oscillospiraceae bacterium]|nr:hypothetical protein [Oscillospiraceae bacterium]